MSIRKIKVLGLLSLPLAAFAVAAVLLSVNLGTSSHHASANNPNSALEYTLHAGGADTTGDAKGSANVTVGTVMTVSVSLDAVPGPYDAIGVTLNYSGVLKGKFETASKNGPKITGNWPDCVFEAAAPLAAGFQNDACAIGAGAPSSTYIGTVLTTQLTCASAGTGEVHLVHSPSDTLVIASSKTSTDNGPDAINVNCVPATNTFTPTPTATPPPIPKVQKTCTSPNVAGPSTLCNVFLHRQGAKIPPTTCLSSTDVATLTEAINIPISTISPKGEAQTLAAFEFEVRYDAKNVCVELAPAGDFASNPFVVCTVRDDTNSTLKGIAQIGCITIGKQHTGTGLTLATIKVHASPELYSQIRPNQDNGIAVQILNQGCNLADEQGHAIPVFSCEDADLTFRYLEGDVDGPDCDVDVIDAQQVAFRWGAHKGSLLYNSFMDLEPSGQVKGNGAIDIKDVQFVFGRFGSNCTNPWPAQLPVNPKA